jgi:hypothetical protein
VVEARTVIMDGGQHRNGLLGNIHASEDCRGLADTGQTLVQDLRRQVAELEVDVIPIWSDTASFADLDESSSERRHREKQDLLQSGHTAP